ncbi:NADP-dependent oxidoreductase [Rhodococcus sp. NPDC003382]
MTTSQTTYRAAVVRKFGPPDVIRIENLPVGEPPAPGVVRVAVRIGGLNPVDARIRSGAFGGAVPHVPGTEFAGTVVAVGAGVGDYTVGDDVIGFGTPGVDAELVDTDPGRLVHKPAALDWAVAGGLSGVGQSAVTAIEATDARAGDVVVVHGAAGGVGTVLTQLLVADGVTVVGTAGESNQDHLRDLGATPVVYGDGLADRIREAVPGRVTVSIDLAGTGEAGDVATAVRRSGGRAVTLVPETATSHGVPLVRVQRSPERLDRLVHAVVDGALRLPVRTVPFTDIVAAHRLLDAKHSRGKLVLDLSGNPFL